MKMKKSLIAVFVAVLLTLPLLFSGFAMADIEIIPNPNQPVGPNISPDPSIVPTIEPEYYKVVFDANGGAWADGDTQKVSSVEAGSLISVGGFMGLPSMNGGEPLSWNTEADGSGKTWNFASDFVTGNLILYAQYTAAAAPALPQTGSESTMSPIVIVAAIAIIACVVIAREKKANKAR